MIPRFFRRVGVFCEYVGRVVHDDPRTGKLYRIGPDAAWSMAKLYHPNPREAAAAREALRDV